MAYYPGNFNYSSPTGSFNFNPALPDWVANPETMLQNLMRARTQARIAEQAPALSEGGRQFDVSTAEGRRQFDLQNALAQGEAGLRERMANRSWDQQQYENARNQMAETRQAGLAGRMMQLQDETHPQWRLNRTPFWGDTWEPVGGTIRLPYRGVGAISSPSAGGGYSSKRGRGTGYDPLGAPFSLV